MKVYARHLLIVLLLTTVIGGVVIYEQGRAVYVPDEQRADSPADCPGSVRLAIIGDYGDNGQPEADVAALVASWAVDYVVTVGDNNYPDGAAATIDANIGQYYANFIYPYQGDYGPGAPDNRFFPALGNHDLDTAGGQPYFDYFTLPGNERYYDVALDVVHLYILNSDSREPDGRSAASPQAQWLHTRLAASGEPWKLVILHHPPFTSSLARFSNPTLQWPFGAAGATAVLSGHDHLYERLDVGGMPYFVNGLGGRALNLFGRPEPESVVRYNQDYGAMRVQAAVDCINFSFFNRQNQLIDSYTIP